MDSNMVDYTHKNLREAVSEQRKRAVVNRLARKIGQITLIVCLAFVALHVLFVFVLGSSQDPEDIAILEELKYLVDITKLVPVYTVSVANFIIGSVIILLGFPVCLRVIVSLLGKFLFPKKAIKEETDEYETLKKISDLTPSVYSYRNREYAGLWAPSIISGILWGLLMLITLFTQITSEGLFVVVFSAFIVGALGAIITYGLLAVVGFLGKMLSPCKVSNKELNHIREAVNTRQREIENEREAQKQEQKCLAKEKAEQEERQRREEQKKSELAQLPAAQEQAQKVREDMEQRFGGDFYKIAKYAKTNDELFAVVTIGWETYLATFNAENGNIDYDSQYDTLKSMLGLCDKLAGDGYLPAKYFDKKAEVEKEFRFVKEHISAEKEESLRPKKTPVQVSSEAPRNLKCTCKFFAAGTCGYYSTSYSLAKCKYLNNPDNCFAALNEGALVFTEY